MGDEDKINKKIKKWKNDLKDNKDTLISLLLWAWLIDKIGFIKLKKVNGGLKNLNIEGDISKKNMTYITNFRECK